MLAEVEACWIGLDVVVDRRADFTAAVTTALIDRRRAYVLILFVFEAAEEAPVHYTSVVDCSVYQRLIHISIECR
jgi:hypothetical protein